VKLGQREMKNIANRRQFLRHTARFSAKYRVKEGAFRDLVHNISAGGVFVSTRQKINHDQPINLQFPICAFKRMLSVMGTVVRCDSNGFAVMFDEAIEEKICKQSQFPWITHEENQST
jgi:hypothetical protein